MSHNCNFVDHLRNPDIDYCIFVTVRQAYFPPISQPEGLPLKVQDSKGKEWIFQFRFWPNNNSRMYVLEGVTPCIQSMQLQAGDIGNFRTLLENQPLGCSTLCFS